MCFKGNKFTRSLAPLVLVSTLAGVSYTASTMPLPTFADRATWVGSDVLIDCNVPGGNGLDLDIQYFATGGDGILGNSDRKTFGHFFSDDPSENLDVHVAGTTLGRCTDIAFLEQIHPTTVSSDNLLGLTYVGFTFKRDGNECTLRGATDRTTDFACDAVRPHIVSIELAPGQTSPTSADEIVWRVTFDVDMEAEHIKADDFIIAGAGAVTVTPTAVTGSSVYDVTVSGGDLASMTGNVSMSIKPMPDFFNAFGNAVLNYSSVAIPTIAIGNSTDTDGDGIASIDELLGPDGIAGTGDETDPNNPDSDGDGLNDGAELAAGSNPNNQDSDGDLVLDGADSNPVSNGAIDDVDLDDDGLIEIDSLTDLDAMRYALDGAGLRFAHMSAADSRGCNGVADGSSPCTGYELMNDLDFDSDGSGSFDAGDSFWNGGLGWLPIGTFTGTFEGNYLTLKNLVMQRPNTSDIGLFSIINAATVQHFTITGAKVSGAAWVGVLTGRAGNSTINQVAINGVVSGALSVGGIIGTLDKGNLIDEVAVLGEVKANVASGFQSAGGIIGWIASNNNLKNVVSHAKVTSDYRIVGGLIGAQTFSLNQYVDIENSFATGAINAPFGAGGLVGSAGYGGSDGIRATSLNWDIETSGRANSSGIGIEIATGLTTAQMQCPTAPNAACQGATGIYAGWDATIWYFGTSSDYPVLAWATDIDGDGVIGGIDADDDGDGISDEDEIANGTNPILEDTDGDGSNDNVDVFPLDPSESADADNDGTGDNADPDDDNDGVDDGADAFPNDPNESVDTDSDGVGNNADLDDDNDFFTDVDEGICGSDPLDGTNKPLDTDIDGLCDNGVDDDDDNDSVSDVNEAAIGSNPLLKDTDSDGLEDGLENANQNGVIDSGETDPTKADTDGDSLDDKLELDTGTNPLSNDSDGDTLLDGAEDANGDGVVNGTETDPRKADSDGDGVDDAIDVFPTDGLETIDTDGDGIGNNADLDDDGDSFSDVDEGICGSDPLMMLIMPIDTDGDGLCDAGVDSDDDNDGVDDGSDAFPLDATESVDTDNDGTGNNADLDDDNDTFSDIDEGVCGTDSLLNTSVPTDTDGDGLCDAGVDSDDDNDGVDDASDAFPLDASETVDTDGDGIGNNADLDDDNDTFSDIDEGVCGTDSLLNTSVPTDTDGDGLCDAGVDSDDDNDGVDDASDAFPLDASETVDTDGDGTGNNADTDDDGDGVDDANDAFPLDPNETVDTDGDGIGNNTDTDDDNDGVMDAADMFPLDPTETLDNDMDGIGDNADPDDDNDGLSDDEEIALGTDPTNSDTDGDGLGDAEDPLPLDPNETVDTDGDGIGNIADDDDDNDGILDADDGFYDTDGDGISNHLDLDSDGDGLSDQSECPTGAPCPDSDGDTFPDFLDAVNNSDDRTIGGNGSGGGSWSWFGLLLLMLFGVRRIRSQR